MTTVLHPAASGGIASGAGVFKYARYPQYGGEMLIWGGCAPRRLPFP